MGVLQSKEETNPIKEKFFSQNNKNHDSSYDDEIDSPVEESNIISYQNQDAYPGSVAKLASLRGDGSKMYDDLQKSDREQEQMHERITLLDKSAKLDTRKVFDGVESVKQEDDISGMPRSELMRDKSYAASKSLINKKSLSIFAKNGQLAKPDQPVEPKGRHMRTPMDPQQKAALDHDIKKIKEDGDMKQNAKGFLSFNRFMHIFILITRHSKEQFIKEQKKVEKQRRTAFRLRQWAAYQLIVQHEIDIERLKYLDVVNYVLQELNIANGCYKSSFIKYQNKREKDVQMKDARHLIMRDIENKQLEEIEFNEEMLDIEKCIKIMKFYEARKLDVLSILSNPFKHQFNKKDRFVLDLAVEQAKIEDQIYAKFDKLEFMLFIKASRHYGLMSQNNRNELNRDALVIKNNAKRL